MNDKIQKLIDFLIIAQKDYELQEKLNKNSEFINLLKKIDSISPEKLKQHDGGLLTSDELKSEIRSLKNREKLFSKLYKVRY